MTRSPSPVEVTGVLQLRDRVQHHVDMIYHDNPLGADLSSLADELLALMRLDPAAPLIEGQVNHWTQRDAIVISYGDSILREGEKPLQTFKGFLDAYGGYDSWNY